MAANQRGRLFDLYEKYVSWLRDAKLFDLNLIAGEWLEKAAPRLHWVSLGELSRAIELLHQDEVNRAVMAGQVKHRILIIPGYAAPLSGRIEEVTGWKVLVGPRDAADIGEFLEKMVQERAFTGGEQEKDML